MFPIRDHNPSSQVPIVTIALIAVNVVVFLYSLQFYGDIRATGSFFQNWAMIPAKIMDGEGLLSLFTSMFLHADFMHIIGNMLFLWIFGDNLEEQMGHFGFLCFYIACGVLASTAHLMADPFSPIPTVGASGAIAGVMGGYLLLFPKARVDLLIIFIVFFRIFTVPAWVILGIWLGLQIFNGIGADNSMGGVAYWAHTGGFVIGLLMTLPIWLARGGTAFWARTHGYPPHPEARYSRSSVPLVRRRR